MHFDEFTNRTAKILGHKWSIIIVVCWGMIGLYSDYVDKITTIFSFVLTFIILNTTNRNDVAIHAKIDELIRAVDKADDNFKGLEEKSEKEILELRQTCKETSENNNVDVQCN